MTSSSDGSADSGPSAFADALAGRLLERRTIVVHEVLSDRLVTRVTEQLMLLAAEAHAPVKVLLGLWGRDLSQGLALHDAFRAAHVKAVAAGRVSGMGVVAFCGARERYALPGAHFRLEEPAGAAEGRSLMADAKEVMDGHHRVVALLAKATGQDAGRLQHDVERRTALDPETAAAYGLVTRVVQSPQDVG